MSTPQSIEEFIALLGEEMAARVTAVVLLLSIPGLNRPIALGESSLWVWHRVQVLDATVESVLYAGDDRNIAWLIAQMINRQVWNMGQG